MQSNAFVCRRVAVFRIILSSFRSTLPYPLWKYIADLGNYAEHLFNSIFWNISKCCVTLKRCWNSKKTLSNFPRLSNVEFFPPSPPRERCENTRSHRNIWRVIKISSYEKFKVSSEIVPSLSISSNDVWKMIVVKWSWLFIIPFFFFL